MKIQIYNICIIFLVFLNTNRAFSIHKEILINDLKMTDIELQKPRDIGGKSVMESINLRQSQRDFDSTKSLTLQELSEVLWAGYGPNRENGHKTVPSAIYMYPLVFYVFTINGVYKYDPDNYKLIHILKGDHRINTGTQDFVKNASVDIVILADYTKKCTLGDCGEEYRFENSNLDASHSSQNIYLYAASEGLKCVERGLFKEDLILTLLGLKKTHKVVITLSVGH